MEHTSKIHKKVFQPKIRRTKVISNDRRVSKYYFSIKKKHQPSFTHKRLDTGLKKQSIFLYF